MGASMPSCAANCSYTLRDKLCDVSRITLARLGGTMSPREDNNLVSLPLPCAEKAALISRVLVLIKEKSANKSRRNWWLVLLGLGLRSFSMHPAQILAVKQEILRSDTTKLALWAQRVRTAEDPAMELAGGYV